MVEGRTIKRRASVGTGGLWHLPRVQGTRLKIVTHIDYKGGTQNMHTPVRGMGFAPDCAQGGLERNTGLQKFCPPPHFNIRQGSFDLEHETLKNVYPMARLRGGD